MIRKRVRGFQSEASSIALHDENARIEDLSAAAETCLREFEALGTPVPLSLRNTALHASRLATTLLSVADEDGGERGEAGRELAIRLMCATNRAMALWSKRVGRIPLDAFLDEDVSSGRTPNA